MRYKAAIFDLDGTLLDTLEDIATSANLVLEQFGKSAIPLDDYNYLVGEGARVLMQKALGGSETKIDEALELFKKFYSSRWYATTKAYDGIIPMLAKLQSANLNLGVLSNKPDVFVNECVKRYFPNTPFLHIAGERADIKRKPDPAGAFVALKALHVKASEACFVGDTKTDMQTATAANINALGVSWGFRDAKELYENGALKVFENPVSLGDYILGQ
jgi:phosphoglycolate phosphatase